MHGPGNIVAIGHVVHYIPDENRDIMVTQKGQAGSVQPGPLRIRSAEGHAVILVWIGRLQRLATAVHDERIARLDGHALGCGDVFEFPAMHGLVNSDVGLAAVFRDIEQHATGNEPGAPMVNTPKGSPFKGNFLVRVAAVPHTLIVPRVTQRVEMGRGDAVIINTHVVCREAPCATWDNLHPVVRWIGVAWAGQFWKVTAERDATARPYERSSLDALGRGDQVNGPDLIVLAPTPPIAP